MGRQLKKLFNRNPYICRNKPQKDMWDIGGANFALMKGVFLFYNGNPTTSMFVVIVQNKDIIMKKEP